MGHLDINTKIGSNYSKEDIESLRRITEDLKRGRYASIYDIVEHLQDEILMVRFKGRCANELIHYGDIDLLTVIKIHADIEYMSNVASDQDPSLATEYVEMVLDTLTKLKE